MQMPARQHDDHAKMAPFVQLLTGCQNRLYVYIRTLLGGAPGAQDVLQDTNLVLWEKAEQYDSERPFMPWAYRFAHLQVLAYRKKHACGRLVFSEEMINAVAEELGRQEGDLDRQLEALNGCIAKLPAAQRQLLDERYIESQPVETIAQRLEHSPNVVAARLYRIRKALARCIEATLAKECIS